MHLFKIRLELSLITKILVSVLITALIASLGVSFYFANKLEQRLASASAQINSLMSEDQYQVNKILQEEIKNINKTYLEAVSSYEQILDLKNQKQDSAKLDSLYAKIVKLLSEKNYASASAVLADLNKQIQEAKPKTVGAQPKLQQPIYPKAIPPKLQATPYNQSQLMANLSGWL